MFGMKRIIRRLFIFCVFFIICWMGIYSSSYQESMVSSDNRDISMLHSPTLDTAVSIERIKYDITPNIQYHLSAKDIAKQEHVGMYILDGNYMNVLPWSNYLVDPCTNYLPSISSSFHYVPSYVDSIVLSSVGHHTR
jgi:uncharacterized membrane protein